MIIAKKGFESATCKLRFHVFIFSLTANQQVGKNWFNLNKIFSFGKMNSNGRGSGWSPRGRGGHFRPYGKRRHSPHGKKSQHHNPNLKGKNFSFLLTKHYDV